MKYESLNPKYFAFWMQQDAAIAAAAATAAACNTQNGILCMLERKIDGSFVSAYTHFTIHLIVIIFYFE